MADLWPLVVVGLPVGAMYGLAALGLVLVHRTTGMLNLAQGAVATAAAFAFHDLHAGRGLPLAVAGAGALAAAAALGLLTAALFARIGAGRPLAQAVASLGLAGAVLGACEELFGPDTVFAAPFLAGVRVALGGAVLSGHQLLVLGSAAAVAVAGGLALTRTWVGLALRGTTGERTAALLVGVPVPRFETASFVAGSVLAGVAGMLLAPLLFLDTTQLGVFFLLKPFAAAVAAGLHGFGGALAAGLVIGVAESVLTRVGIPGLGEVVPLAVVLAALVRRRPTSRAGPPLATGPARRPGSGPRWPAWALTGLAVAVVPHLTAYQATVVQLAAVTAVLACSHVVVTGWVGQLSLAHPALAGVGAVAAAHLAVRLHLPFPLPLLLAPLAAVPVGVLAGLPALRSRGLVVAAVTLAFSAAASAVLFAWEPFIGGAGARALPAPALGGVDLAGPRFTWVAVAAAGAAFAAVRCLARSRWGAGMLAVREHSRAAAALGIPVRPVTLVAFAAAGWLCGLAGALSAYQLGSVSLEQYHPLVAVPVLAVAVVGGVESLWGAALGGALHAAVPEVLRALSAEALTGAVTPAALLAVLCCRPGGLASLGARRRGGADPAASPPAPAPWALAEPAAPAVMVVAAGASPPALAVRGLSVRYGALRAVDGVDLQVQRGEIVALIGPNGAGKTTVFEAVSGFVPAAGRVELDGRSLDGLAAHRRARAGLVRTFQGGGLFPRLTVADNLDVALRWAPGGPSAGAVVAAAGLGAWAGTAAAELPHGTARVVEVTRALCLAPRVVLLDEPAAGLSAAEAADLVDAVRRGRDRTGCAVVLVEHDLRVVAAADRVVVLDEGRALAAGALDEVRRDPAVAAAYLGTGDEPAVAAPAGP